MNPVAYIIICVYSFIEKDVLVLQAKSPGDLSKVINHRKKLMADKLPKS